MGTGPFFSVQPAVFIVESPSPDDILYGRTEGQALSAALNLAEIKNEMYMALDEAAIKHALADAAGRVRHSLAQIRPHIIPVVHISAHGNEHGLGLSNGKVLPWAELRKLLLTFLEDAKSVKNRTDDLSLTSLCLSVCQGAHASMMFDAGMPYPCLGLVGPTEDVDWADSLTAFVTFYHQLFYKDALVTDAVAAMNIAGGVSSFRVFFPADLKAHFRQYGLYASDELESRIRGSTSR
jgi:hypothetical protein